MINEVDRNAVYQDDNFGTNELPVIVASIGVNLVFDGDKLVGTEVQIGSGAQSLAIENPSVAETLLDIETFLDSLIHV